MAIFINVRLIIKTNSGFGCDIAKIFKTFLSSNASVGNSVANARAAKVSIIRLTQSNWIAVKGDSPPTTAPMQETHTATTLTVSWKVKNFEMES